MSEINFSFKDKIGDHYYVKWCHDKSLYVRTGNRLYSFTAIINLVVN